MILLALDPVGIFGDLVVEVCVDGCRGGAFDRDAFDRHVERGGEVFTEAGLLREHVAASGKDNRTVFMGGYSKIV